MGRESLFLLFCVTIISVKCLVLSLLNLLKGMTSGRDSGRIKNCRIGISDRDCGLTHLLIYEVFTSPIRFLI